MAQRVPPLAVVARTHGLSEAALLQLEYADVDGCWCRGPTRACRGPMRRAWESSSEYSSTAPQCSGGGETLCWQAWYLPVIGQPERRHPEPCVCRSAVRSKIISRAGGHGRPAALARAVVRTLWVGARWHHWPLDPCLPHQSASTRSPRSRITTPRMGRGETERGQSPTRPRLAATSGCYHLMRTLSGHGLADSVGANPDRRSSAGVTDEPTSTQPEKRHQDLSIPVCTLILPSPCLCYRGSRTQWSSSAV
ncbi:hypothetical protein BC739_004001 [Kutzneria viridogrisea]|uniref:Uncharacterized protein n=1 Tax=Kutzneria viridogrisea TaxID=47990 RepID=A0ABR6BIT0_9PSEU|nr:hypothetical protein [Kutzneria viridogrisea]